MLADRDWRLSDVPDVVLEVDTAKLRGALLNLIDNAIKATRPAETIAISAFCNEGSGEVILVVEDSGPGIADEEREAVLQRFGRIGGADREGSGLGLAIVTAVAEAHGGSFHLAESDLGGCRCVIALPRALVSVEALVPAGV